MIALGLIVGASAVAEVSNSRRGGDSQSSFISPNVHWTLADWLTQKQNSRNEDLWLVLHTKTPQSLGLVAAGGQIPYTLDHNSTKTSQWENRGVFGLSYSIFGIQYQYEKNDLEILFGNQKVNSILEFSVIVLRTTFWLFSYGLRKWDFANPSSSVSNPYASSQLNLYIFKFLGIEGAYQYFFKANDGSQKSYSGNRVEYGPFLDFRVIKVFGKFFSESTATTPSGGTETTDTRSGTEIGAELGF